MTRTQDWMKEAACKGMSFERFLLPVGVTVAQARLPCPECPVRLDCLNYALDNHIVEGVYGGLSYRQRRRYRQLRLHPNVTLR